QGKPFSTSAAKILRFKNPQPVRVLGRPRKLIEFEAGKCHRGAGLGSKRLAVVQMRSARSLEQVNERIQGRKTADPSFILIFGNGVKKAGPIQIGKPIY